MTTVEMLLELEEQDYIGMGLGRALVRTMLRKAKEIATSAPPVESKVAVIAEPPPEQSDNSMASVVTVEDDNSSNSTPLGD